MRPLRWGRCEFSFLYAVHCCFVLCVLRPQLHPPKQTNDPQTPTPPNPTQQSNKQLAPRIIAEQRPRFQAARMAHRERKRKLEGIDASAWPLPPGAYICDCLSLSRPKYRVALSRERALLLPVLTSSTFANAHTTTAPPFPPPPPPNQTATNHPTHNPDAGKGGPQQEQQVRLWKAYVDSERSNHQRLEREALVARVALAYDQALMCLRCFPEVRGWGGDDALYVSLCVCVLVDSG